MKKKLAVKQEFKQESEFNICAKTGAGSGVNVFGAGVDSESKILDSDHLCFQVGLAQKCGAVLVFDFKLAANFKLADW